MDGKANEERQGKTGIFWKAVL